MKTFTLAAAAALALASAAPALADQATNDDPFVSTQGELTLTGSTGMMIGGTMFFIAVAASGDS